MAGYRPLGLSPSAGSTIIAGRATSYAERRRAVAERLSRAEDITRQVDDAADPDGTLRACIRALLPLAQRAESFDLTVSLGPEHVRAARIVRGPDGVTAELVPGIPPAGAAGSGPAERPPAAQGPAAAGPGAAPGPSESKIASELAALLRTREVGAR